MNYLQYSSIFAMLWLLAACGGADNGIEPADSVKNSSKIEGSKIYHNPISADKPLDPNEAARIEFEEYAHDFGTIRQGEKAEHIFTFKNTGKAALLISKARASCGCTVPEWPREPIPPGQEGEIKVIFDSVDKEGLQEKTVTITSNTMPNQNKLRITGHVVVE